MAVNLIDVKRRQELETLSSFGLGCSHVSEVAIAVLLVNSIGLFLRGISRPLVSAADFLVTAIAIRGIPFSSPNSPFLDKFTMATTFSGLSGALAAILAASFLSLCCHKLGPIRVLANSITERNRSSRV